jgi:hypothetical protein
LVRRIVSNSRALRPYIKHEHSPGSQWQTDEELIEAAGKIGTTIFHPVGMFGLPRYSFTQALPLICFITEQAVSSHSFHSFQQITWQVASHPNLQFVFIDTIIDSFLPVHSSFTSNRHSENGLGF